MEKIYKLADQMDRHLKERLDDRDNWHEQDLNNLFGKRTLH
jgi:hypothetical protein